MSTMTMPEKPNRPKRRPFQIRLPDPLRTQLEALVERRATDLTTEVVEAIRDRLESFGLWPPSPQPPEEEAD